MCQLMVGKECGRTLIRNMNWEGMARRLALNVENFRDLRMKLKYVPGGLGGIYAMKPICYIN